MYVRAKLKRTKEWAKKVSRCIAGCNFVNYAPFKEILLFKS